MTHAPPAGETALSAGVQALLPMVGRAAAGFRTALITGEAGTGKDLLARTLHGLSPRVAAPLVTLDCSTLNPETAERELFGAAAGGAALVRGADGGTLVLDEIACLPPAAQARLHRLIERRELQPVEAGGASPIDSLVIALSRRPLAADVAAGAFRADLWQSLSAVNLVIAPLRQSPHDLRRLARELLEEFAVRFQCARPRLSGAAEDAIARYHWPGNMRELRAVLVAACLRAGDSVVTPAHLPLAETPRRPGALTADVVRDALQHTRGNKKAAAAYLGVGRRSLYRLLDKWSLCNAS